MRATILIAFFIVLGNSVFAATVQEKVYILRDSIQVSSGLKLPYLTFNATNSYTSTNARIVLNQGDELDLWVVNFDSEIHEFEIKGVTIPVSIPAGDSIQIVETFSNPGIFIFQDSKNYPDWASTGLGSFIAVKDHTHASFYWNIKEHQEGTTTTIQTGGSVDWTTYYPEHFTLNGRHNPNINADSDARIVGDIGDTLILYMANTGLSIHPMHFHGYHAEILYSTRNPEHVGRMKDSQGIYPGEGIIFRIVPDKDGEYPVHDHNLISTTGGNMYPMGMFTTILIGP